MLNGKSFYETHHDKAKCPSCMRDEGLHITGFSEAHTHQAIELQYVISGSVESFIGEKRYLLKSGMLLAVSSGYIHGIAYASEDSEWYVAIIQPNCAGTALEEKLSKYAFDQVLLHDCPERTFFALLTEFHRNTYRLTEIHRRIEEIPQIEMQKAMGRYLLHLITTMAGLHEREVYADKCSVILNYIQQHYLENISVHSVSEATGIPQQMFSDSFEPVVGMYAKEYINYLRIQKSCEYLEEGRSIQEISFKCGFSSDRTFYRAFKKYMGSSPLKWLKKK
ncbi:MAG: AraC family transcriptional regulator [Oscillospiraceae bacterium]